jgi:hypothetical protein
VFTVWSVDQPSETGETFSSVEQVKEHLGYLATLPRYCLDLEGNPGIEVTTDTAGTATSITDKQTGERFGIRTADLENTTRLCVHADALPTIGNLRPA